MASRFVERVAGLAARLTGVLKADSAGNVAPFGIDADDEKLKFYDRTADTYRTVSDGRLNVETLTAARTITMADSGKTFFLNAAAGFAVTLPLGAAAAGLDIEFFVKAAPSGGTYTIVTAGAPEQTLGGAIHSSTGGDGDSETAATGTTVTFADGVAVYGDYCRIVGDGAGFYATIFTNADAGATITG